MIDVKLSKGEIETLLFWGNVTVNETSFLKEDIALREKLEALLPKDSNDK